VEYVANLLNGDIDPAAWARRREDEGWPVLGCADHLFSPRRAYPHLWVTLATFAAATSRPMLTSSFANNLLRTPVEFSQAALQMQAVSDGRFEAGLGAGWDETEIVGAGLDYPPARTRAGRYAEAVQIVRQLLHDGACQFHGEFYDIDIPVLGPRTDPPPPIVVSLGGPRTIREIAPLVDRVELKIVSAATKGGVLDVAALATISRHQVDELVAKVREVNPTVPLGVMVLCNVGTDERTTSIEALLGDSFMGGFFGPPGKVAAALADLAESGVTRIQLSPFFDESFELLAPHLFGR
jgi:alkanesulfonate monooxygenase SsuD/methylene tetrahydromethanopterin reductase-like flavin-dependent oxidoreductase (luciferase family)